ncbi:MAG TPA: dienelactone hydrolase family protein [Longimicrobium sp.]|jgi:carboxymethylenebutenolidase|nr:dienelactone hydrolase family protein [Longimicrobium sp.]
MRGIVAVLALSIVSALSACAPHPGASADTAAAPARTQGAIPAGAAEVRVRLAASPRHGEWVTVSTGTGDSVRAWIVFPERRDRAPVVVVVHEIFGLTGWIRGVADQLAADGFIAIAPDLLSGKGIPAAPDGDPVRDSATAAIRTLDPAAVQRRLDATARYAMALPAALPRYGIVGFCWGGGVSFAHAAHAPNLGASVVYYGVSPAREALANVRAPVLGLYGENDARVDATIAPADSALRALGRTYQHQVFTGAGHGFLRQQDGENGANLQAARAAWPRTVQWFHRYLRG